MIDAQLAMVMKRRAIGSPMNKQSKSSRCKGHTREGKPCRAAATEGGRRNCRQSAAESVDALPKLESATAGQLTGNSHFGWYSKRGHLTSLLTALANTASKKGVAEEVKVA